MTLIFEKILREEQIEEDLIPQVCKLLTQSKDSFCLWLRGDLGAGKTTLGGKLLHGLGLPANVPVLSPTFTYMTEYKTSTGLIAHLDLYRMVDGDLDSVSTLLADRKFAGMVVEWPERCPGAEEISPTLILDISFAESNSRKYRLTRTQ